MTSMNRLNRFFVLLLPICPAFGDAITACPSTTFNVYLSKYQNGCSVGPLIFSNFTWSSYTVPPAGKPNAPDPITADKVDVSAMNQSNCVGLSFNAAWQAVGIQEQTNYFSFTVQALPDVLILGARATIAGQTAGSIVNQAAFRDTLCPGGTFDKNSACVVNGKFISQVVPYPTQDKLSDTEMFTAPVDSVSAQPRIRVVSIDPKGSASMAQATSEFQVTPEPSSFTLIFIGLAATGIAGHTRLRRAGLQQVGRHSRPRGYWMIFVGQTCRFFVGVHVESKELMR